jgi:hypothetical protein
MDSGDGYYNGPILPLGLTYDTDTSKGANTFGQRAQKWKAAEKGGLVVAWRAQVRREGIALCATGAAKGAHHTAYLCAGLVCEWLQHLRGGSNNRNNSLD